MNKQTQHTPGPWFYEGQNIRNGDGLDVATVDSERSTERCTSDRIPLKEWTANTRLIAAAPDLFESLQRTHRFLASVEGFLQDHELWGDDEQDLLEANERAIAKSEGRAN
jgi:hypothetical protein